MDKLVIIAIIAFITMILYNVWLLIRFSLVYKRGKRIFSKQTISLNEDLYHHIIYKDSYGQKRAYLPEINSEHTAHVRCFIVTYYNGKDNLQVQYFSHSAELIATVDFYNPIAYSFNQVDPPELT